jgi:UDP-N-acetylmuramate dehydrogenase
LSHEVVELTAAELGFGYRDSIFKSLGRLGVITWVEFELQPYDAAAPAPGLSRLTEAVGREVSSPAEVRAAVLATRAQKGMVLDAADRDTWSCGSFFTNPIVSDGFSRSIPGEAPRWLQPDGTVKLSAAWLIENSGLSKGFRLGHSNAGLSSKHALAITNRGGATAKEVFELSKFIQLQVANRWGVELAAEPNFVGDFYRG